MVLEIIRRFDMNLDRPVVVPDKDSVSISPAEQAEAKEAQETLDIPAELARREKRAAALKQARQVIEQRAKEFCAFLDLSASR